jgi:hypothetical protein
MNLRLLLMQLLLQLLLLLLLRFGLAPLLITAKIVINPICDAVRAAGSMPTWLSYQMSLHM